MAVASGAAGRGDWSEIGAPPPPSGDAAGRIGLVAGGAPGAQLARLTTSPVMASTATAARHARRVTLTGPPPAR